MKRLFFIATAMVAFMIRTSGASVFIVSTFERGKSGFFRGEATNEVGEALTALAIMDIIQSNR